MKYVLSGSLGNINKPLATQLIAAGHDVTIISSDAGKQQQIAAMGAKAAIGKVQDVAFLTEAFKGADAVFTLVPPMFATSNWKEDIHQVGKNFAAAIKASGVKKVVNLSSIGAHMPTGCGPVSGIHFVEQELNALDGVAIKHLRPGYFYTNTLHDIGLIKAAGIYGNNFGPEAKMVMVHPDDIAAVAAKELQSLQFTGSSIQYIAGDELTCPQIASVLGAAIGKPELPYVPFSDEQYFDGAVKAGLSEEIARNYTEMGQALRSGEMISDFEKHRVMQGKIKFEDFAKEFAVIYAQGH
jgi:uncharacterized protein YbjT (DUF2867 family)